MIVRFDKSFGKAIDKVKDKAVLKRIENSILKVEMVQSIEELTSVRKLIGYSTYYRIKVGDYRIGIEKVSSNEIRFVTVLHRKDIYKRFP
ncbi:MAG: type II toxin-antitoxin system RelE/ParE family toxin [Bacteroidetes bacterium]|nr:type II toxin-antitoxin system RelE/ParE family toxin [Bacteroidota bacterium]